MGQGMIGQVRQHLLWYETSYGIFSTKINFTKHYTQPQRIRDENQPLGIYQFAAVTGFLGFGIVVATLVFAKEIRAKRKNQVKSAWDRK